MDNMNATEVRKDIYRLIDEINTTHRPIRVSGKRNKVVMVAESDWEAMKETVYLLSIPGFEESIKEGDSTPIEECMEDIGWDIKLSTQSKPTQTQGNWSAQV